MASLLRQIVAGPRAKHAETGLDLCYVTSNIIATSGPSQTYPQRAYRNPLDQLVAFLDEKHGDGWAIWEFRAEGTGYPDEAVYGRIRHYPWPDHHPPPFRLVPMIVASMKHWLNGGEIEDGAISGERGQEQGHGDSEDPKSTPKATGEDGKANGDRVVVVHCKAGKGRSGTMACSYLIAECGWTPDDALSRFTARRMRPSFGAGVSIPSQLRWVSYVDRWTKGGKKYVDREIEIVEIHAVGLRHGVKVSVEGYIDEGKKIKTFHTFTRDERIVVEGDTPGGSGVFDLVTDMAGYGSGTPKEEEEPEYQDVVAGSEPQDNAGNGSGVSDKEGKPVRSASKKLKNAKTALTKKLSTKIGSSQSLSKLGGKGKNSTMPSSSVGSSTTSLGGGNGIANSQSQFQSAASLQKAPTFASSSEPGGLSVIFKPREPIRIPNNDVNIAVERRNSAAMGLTMVTSVAHVWFNTFFEGRGPEQDGNPDDSGVFEIEWNKLDGIKGSSQKGTRACERLSVVWRVVGGGLRSQDETSAALGAQAPAEPIHEPGKDSPVPQMRPANWKGGNDEDPDKDKHLGLRVEDPDSAEVSKANSIKETSSGEEQEGKPEREDADLEGVKTSGPEGEETLSGTDTSERPQK